MRLDDNYQNLGRATHCSIAFFILSISANSVQNVESQAMNNDGYAKLGFFSLALLYGCLGMGSLIATPIMHKIGAQKCMIIGSCCDALWILGCTLPALKSRNEGSQSFFLSTECIYIVSALTSICDGFGGALQWVAQGKYISDCATVKTKGFFFGYFWAFYMASQIFGNILAAYVFRLYDQVIFYTLMATFSLTSGVIFSFLLDPKKVEEPDEQELPQLQNYSTMERQREHNPILEQPVLENTPSCCKLLKKDIASIFRLIFSHRMRWALPEMIWAGISLSVYTGLLVPMIVSTIPNDDEGSQLMKSMMSMATLGLGEIIGALLIGQIIDKLGNKATSYFTLSFIAIQTSIVLTFLYFNTYNYLVFAMTLVWGIQDSAVNTHMSEILGFEFETNVEPFSVFNLVQSFTIFIFLTGEAYVNTRSGYFGFMIFVAVLGFLMCGATLNFNFNKKEKQRSDQDQQTPQRQVDLEFENEIKVTSDKEDGKTSPSLEASPVKEYN